MAAEGQRRLRRGRFARAAALGGMAARLAGDAVSAAGQLATAGTTGAAARKLHEKAARTLNRSQGDMKGLPMKLGQMLSYIDDFVPAEYRDIYRDTLRELQVRTRPMLWERIEEMIVADLGKPVDELFATFDREPIAAASIGQVYRATTHEGRDVAVKVQYPGIAEAVTSDLRNVDTVVRTLTIALPHFDVEQTVADLTARVGEECDYRAEADNQRLFGSAWAADAEVVIPEVLPALCGKRVLTTEYIEGRSWQRMLSEATDEQRSRYGRAIFRFVFRSLYVFGMFNADPHPGNYLFLDDGRVAFLDFGCVQRFDPTTLRDIAKVRKLAVAGVRGQPFRDELQRAYGLPDTIDDGLWEHLEGYLMLSFEPSTSAQPYRYSRDYTERLTRATMALKLELGKRLLKVGIFETKREGTVFLHRINFGLNSILAALEATADWPATMVRIDAEAEDGWKGAA